MKVTIAWKTLDNIQEKTFKDESACIQWIRIHSKDIVSINGVLTMGEILNHFDILTCLRAS